MPSAGTNWTQLQHGCAIWGLARADDQLICMSLTVAALVNPGVPFDRSPAD